SGRRAVLENLENNPGAKLSEVSEEIGMSLSSVKRAVVSLKKEGYLRNDGNNRKSVWVVL
ncbi:MAG: helix-turn-helix domain-containing protein, partial [Candidatus Methanomethylophilaceae archaeon]|nr:helix-turn-helix domain-containing protein [Candidatus Methanomethylophilaceae archaeon]